MLPQGSLQRSVEPLYHAVALWVVGGSLQFLNPKELAYICRKVRLAPQSDNRLSDTPKKGMTSCTRISAISLVRDQVHQGPFGKEVLEDQDMFVPLGGCRQVHDVHTNYLEWPIHGDRMQGWPLHFSTTRHHGTLRAISNIVDIVSKHPFPPPVPGKGVEQPIPREMSCHWPSVALIHDFRSEMLGYNHSLLPTALWVNEEQDVVHYSEKRTL